MTENKQREGGRRAVIRWLFAAAFVFAVIVSGIFSGLMNKAGLFYLIIGSIAVAFMGFSRHEIGAAFRHAAGRPGPPDDVRRSAYFFEAAARNAWILGVLGSAMNFTIALSSESGGIAATTNRLIQSYIVTLYGLVLAAICLVPSMKLKGQAEKTEAVRPSGQGPARPVLLERAAAYILFVVVLGLTIFFLVRGYPQSGPLPVAKVMLHFPAALVVFGGAIALALFMGAGTGARALTLGFAMTGFISLLMGLIQAMLGFAHTSVQEIASAIAFIISASSFALLGLVVIAAPLEDREVMDGRRERPGPLSRMFWAVFPLLAFIFMILTLIMVITPMKKPG